MVLHLADHFDGHAAMRSLQNEINSIYEEVVVLNITYMMVHVTLKIAEDRGRMRGEESMMALNML